MPSRPQRLARVPKPGWNPELWATRLPLRQRESFAELFRAAWENRDNLAYAWRILCDGVCDGCALGATGLSDWTVDGVHLCKTRLRLLRLSTMPALDITRLEDVAPLRGMRARQLCELGHLRYPLLRRKGEAGFRRVSWEEALALMVERLRVTDPARTHFYEARPEWEVITELAARVRPELAEKVRFAGTRAIRAEIARVIPHYHGIQHLMAKGDQFQYGGPRLCEGWRFPTPDGKARFHTAPLPEPVGSATFMVVTRRGRQFNSMIHEGVDPLTRQPRDAVLLNQGDLTRLGLREGDQVVVENVLGSFTGRVFAAPVAAGSVHLHWPEANVLSASPARVPPDQGTRATVRRAAAGEVSALPRLQK